MGAHVLAHDLPLTKLSCYVFWWVKKV